MEIPGQFTAGNPAVIPDFFRVCADFPEACAFFFEADAAEVFREDAAVFLVVVFFSLDVF